MFALIVQKEKRMLSKSMASHPLTVYWALFLGMPVFLLLPVFVCATAVILPISLLLGWL